MSSTDDSMLPHEVLSILVSLLIVLQNNTHINLENYIYIYSQIKSNRKKKSVWLWYIKGKWVVTINMITFLAAIRPCKVLLLIAACSILSRKCPSDPFFSCLQLPFWRSIFIWSLSILFRLSYSLLSLAVNI